MKIEMKARFAAAAIALMAVAAPASAQTAHSNRASFNAAAPVTTLIDFNGPSLSTATSVTFPPVTFSCTGTVNCPGFFGTRNLGNGGTGSVFYATPDAATFTFATAINAFGIDILGVGTTGATTFEALVNGQSYTIAANYSSGAPLFFGLTGVSFTSVTFTGTSPNDGMDFDDLAFNNASVVPEPATWAMLITGFGLTGAVTRRRRQASARLA